MTGHSGTVISRPGSVIGLHGGVIGRPAGVIQVHKVSKGLSAMVGNSLGPAF